jgi:hypothetical protein
MSSSDAPKKDRSARIRRTKSRSDSNPDKPIKPDSGETARSGLSTSVGRRRTHSKSSGSGVSKSGSIRRRSGGRDAAVDVTALAHSALLTMPGATSASSSSPASSRPTGGRKAYVFLHISMITKCRSLSVYFKIVGLSSHNHQQFLKQKLQLYTHSHQRSSRPMTSQTIRPSRTAAALDKAARVDTLADSPRTKRKCCLASFFSFVVITRLCLFFIHDTQLCRF